MNEFSRFVSAGISGYIMLPRALINHLIFENDNSMTNTQAFITLLALANYKNVEQGKCLFRRGDSHATQQYLAKLFNWSETKVRRFLKDLEDIGAIRINKESNPHTITLLHYEELCANKKVKKDKEPENKNDEQFAQFWESYHLITQQSPQDIEMARHEWNKLTSKEKVMPTDNIMEYFMGLKNVKFVRKAVNYLKQKTFILS